MTVDVQAPRPGLLYLADTWFPGWTATVNGQPVPILVANYAFRAVPVPAGRDVIQFTYWPAGLNAGLIISSICLAACAYCFLLR